jgi:hypothetical protein
MEEKSQNTTLHVPAGKQLPRKWNKNAAHQNHSPDTVILVVTNEKILKW